MGFSIEEISNILDNYEDKDNIDKVLSNKFTEIEGMDFAATVICNSSYEKILLEGEDVLASGLRITVMKEPW